MKRLPENNITKWYMYLVIEHKKHDNLIAPIALQVKVYTKERHTQETIW